MFPNVHKKRKSKKGFLGKVFGKANTSRKPPKRLVEKRSETIGQAVTKNLVARPLKAAGTMMAATVFKDIPELGILGMALSGFVSDVKHVISGEKEQRIDFKKSGEHTTKAINRNTFYIKTLDKKLDLINNAIAKQSTILDGGFGVLSTKLDGLDPIYTELRTLSALTAKLNEISKRSLAQYRAQNRVQVLKEKNKRFAETEKVSKEKTIDEEEKQEKDTDAKAAPQPTPPPTENKGMFGNLFGGLGEAGVAGAIGGALSSALSGLGGMILKAFTTLLEGSGLAKLLRFTPVAIVGLLAESMGMEELKVALKTDFSKIGKNLEEAFSKEGLKGAMKTFFSDAQIGALGNALLKGWKDVMDPVVNGIQGILNWINPKLAKGVGKVVDTVEGGIGQGVKFGHDLMFGDEAKEDLGRINTQRLAHGLPLMTMDEFTHKKPKVQDVKKADDAIMPEPVKDDVFKDQTIKQVNKPRMLAEKQAAEQNTAMQLDAAKDAAMMATGVSKGGGQVNINAPQNTSNSATYNITSSDATRENWVRNYSENLKQP